MNDPTETGHEPSHPAQSVVLFLSVGLALVLAAYYAYFVVSA